MAADTGKSRAARHEQAPVNDRSSVSGVLLGSGESGFDRLLHERSRLAIISLLAAHPVLSFNELKSMLQATDGNLSVHARKLEEAGYISCRKLFEGRVPRTEYSITGKGRSALQAYIGHMEALIKAVKQI
jgi:DNA-binding HxlR family transcriptional regulator